MPTATPDSKFDYLSKAEDLVINSYMEVAGTIYIVAGLGFNGVETVEIILVQHEDPLLREITIRADADQIFGVWSA